MESCLSKHHRSQMKQIHGGQSKSIAPYLRKRKKKLNKNTLRQF